jgi:hypothetical protein
MVLAPVVIVCSINARLGKFHHEYPIENIHFRRLALILISVTPKEMQGRLVGCLQGLGELSEQDLGVRMFFDIFWRVGVDVTV